MVEREADPGERGQHLSYTRPGHVRARSQLSEVLMCGISGVVAVQAEGAASIVDAQLDGLHHRGPNARGHFDSRRGAIAQNRLSIIDLVTGDPPITNEDRTVAVVLNGEIYNYRELRDQLRRDGHEFGSKGDTETIAHLAEQLAPVELARGLDGMFAFAVWDERRRRLVLGRDRVGKKPLYYWHGGGRLVFGSEIKAVLADPAVPRELEDGAISAYLTFGYVPTPRTFFAGVRSLPPGHVLTFEPGGEPVIERYWEPPVVGNGLSRLELPARRRQARGPLASHRRRLPQADLGRAARRVPERGDRLERDRRDHGLADGPAGRDFHDRLR